MKHAIWIIRGWLHPCRPGDIPVTVGALLGPVEAVLSNP